ncbi:LysR substrate-binding domain-containing protein [Photobacterium sp. TY1-4]|uniref:LysR substrate-binding domain-containing protein n=1 Tax=Photobacterium sp. TY1-4 TaxID=2899122 RepID=UPI0021BE24E1|nr:LysR substrate-binding domain-containing protein [Photobacterium sp. TY1-4]UXI00115.1 LysR substrate-binding domain-containing protein [Photobacterium sp. TY1-4]
MYKNINLLVTFECAARHNSYSLAAGELCISQAAVSQQMRQLERDLGCRLFIRKNRQMLLTQQGQALFDGAQPALRMIDRTLNHIHTEDVAGELTISSTQAFTTLWLMPRLQRFSELHPDIQVRIVSSPGFDDLKQSHIDLAIRFGVDVEKHTPKTLACDYFGEDFVYPVCSVRLMETLALASPQDLLSTWLVTLENPGYYSWHHWFEHAGVDGSEHHELWTRVSSTDMALNAVQSGHGVTLAVTYLCRRRLDTGELVIPFDQPHPNSVKRYFVYDPYSAKKARLQVFMQWLKSEMSSEGEHEPSSSK